MALEDELRQLTWAVRDLARREVDGWLVFGIGPVQHTNGAVAPTPQFERSPIGDLLVMLTLTATQKARLTVAFKDGKGNDAVVDGKPSWGVDNPNVAAITPSDDGMSCDLVAVGPIGSALVSVQADADMGEGTRPVAGTLEVTVTAGEAAAVEITPGQVEQQ